MTFNIASTQMKPEEVIETSKKREQSLQEVGVAVITVSGEDTVDQRR